MSKKGKQKQTQVVVVKDKAQQILDRVSDYLRAYSMAMHRRTYRGYLFRRICKMNIPSRYLSEKEPVRTEGSIRRDLIGEVLGENVTSPIISESWRRVGPLAPFVWEIRIEMRKKAVWSERSHRYITVVEPRIRWIRRLKYKPILDVGHMLCPVCLKAFFRRDLRQRICDTCKLKRRRSKARTRKQRQRERRRRYVTPIPHTYIYEEKRQRG